MSIKQHKKIVEKYNNNMRYTQDELALQYLPAVKGMAYRLKERLPSSVDTVDLVSIGAEELVKLARRYDEGINDSFWGYAKKRVYGSMLDYLRSLDVVSRSSRKLIKQIEEISYHYMNDHEDEPSDEYLANELNEDIKKIREARAAADIYTLMPIDEQLIKIEDESTAKKVEQQELVEIIKETLSAFEEREQMIIQLYYFEELNLKEISQVLGITESRISQIHKLVIKKIRERLGGHSG